MSKNGTEISNKHRPERCDTFLKSFEAGSKTGVLFHTCCPDDDKPVQCVNYQLEPLCDMVTDVGTQRPGRHTDGLHE